MTSTQTPYCNFTVAVDRKFKDANGERQADFISCVAWRQTATFIGKYFHKGNRIGLTGSIQTRNYEDSNGQKRYVTGSCNRDAEFVDHLPGAATIPVPVITRGIRIAALLHPRLHAGTGRGNSRRPSGTSFTH